MQDRFKFRIYEKETKKMIELDAIGYSSFDPFAEGKSRLIMIPTGINNTYAYNSQCLYDNDKFSEPMQCTGLKDKNGTLIYEGDIVKDDHDAWHYVKWVYDSWQLFPCTQNNYTIGIVDDEIEVIGNIYENKELLNG